METIWYYSVQGGTPSFWRNKGETALYTPNGRCDFYEENGYWYRMAGGQPAYYLDDERKWVYTMDGKPAFYRGD